ncbi:MAG TPA: cysteine desulfurase family protein [Alphaproteobacteria bacterium]|nr:cysteine desulfurase family protein [Alphaproteobacteria bacterium]
MDRAVYMDFNATAPVRPEAIEAVTAALRGFGNPSSVHRFGRLARRALEDAREEVARLVNAAPSTIVFTSGGTESNALALRGTNRARVIASSIEHDSVLRNVDAEIVSVTRDGVVDLAALENMLAQDRRPALVAVMLANNETGIIQPVAEAAEIAHRYGALLLCDAVQAAGKIEVDAPALGADLLSLSAHKLGGPKGVGALYVAPHVELKPILSGGGQERKLRAGTENVPGIAGFAAAARAAREGLVQFAAVARLRDALESRVARLAPDARVFGAHLPRLANTSCLAMPGVSSETQVIAFDLAGIAVSAGAACSSGKVEPSRVLRAMGVDDGTANSAIRVSLGWTSGAQDIDRFIEAWGGLYAARSRAASAPAA